MSPYGITTRRFCVQKNCVWMWIPPTKGIPSCPTRMNEKGCQQGAPDPSMSKACARAGTHAPAHHSPARHPSKGVLAMTSSSVVTPSATRRRSEEHTSELQSHSDLVCRLLLEKKKK